MREWDRPPDAEVMRDEPKIQRSRSYEASTVASRCSE
jgi:hypothetical protein